MLQSAQSELFESNNVTDNNEEENTNALQQEKAETEAEQVDQYDPEAEAKQAEEYWKEFTGVKSASDEDIKSEKEDTATADSSSEDEESGEESSGPDETSEVSDNKKAQQVFQQAEETKKGNKNYIDHDLINSIEDKELRQKVWNLANTAQSHYHRVYAKETEVNKLRNQIAQLEAEREVAKQSATTKSQESKIDKATEEKISRLKRDYPDLADSIQAMFEKESEAKQKEFREMLEKEYSPIKQRFEEDSRQQEIEALTQAANEIFQTETTGVSYREVVASPDFQTWLANQDESIKRLANSDRAAEVISVLKNFEYDYSREYQKAYGKSWVEAVTGESMAKKPSSTQPSTDPELAQKAESIKQKRETKKKAAVTGIAPSRHSTSADANVDADAYFKHFAAQSRYAQR